MIDAMGKLTKADWINIAVGVGFIILIVGILPLLAIIGMWDEYIVP